MLHLGAGGHDVDGVDVTLPHNWHFNRLYTDTAQRDQLVYGGGPLDLFAAATYRIKGSDAGDACTWLDQLPSNGAVFWVQEWLVQSSGAGRGLFYAQPGKIDLHGTTTLHDCASKVPPERLIFIDDAGRHFWISVALGKDASPALVAETERVLNSVGANTDVVPAGGALLESLQAPLTKTVSVGGLSFSVPDAWSVKSYVKGSDVFLQASLFPLTGKDHDSMSHARTLLGPYQLAIEVTNRTSMFGSLPPRTNQPLQVLPSDLCSGCVSGSGKHAQARFLAAAGTEHFVVFVEFGSYGFPQRPVSPALLAQANRILATLSLG